MTGHMLDVYTLRARVFPALVALAPAFALGAVLTNWDDLGMPEAIGTLAFGLCLFVLSDVARRQGRRIETGVFARMGGMPSTSMLRHRDVHVDAVMKERAHGFLSGAVGCAMPTIRDETERPAEADHTYRICADWLRENTRDAKRFKLLKEENIVYGFRRNLYGLKPAALVVGIVSLTCIAGVVWRLGIEEIGPEWLLSLVGAGLVAIVQVAYFTFIVTEQSVREAARQYGRQLLLCCEIMRSGI